MGHIPRLCPLWLQGRGLNSLSFFDACSSLLLPRHAFDNPLGAEPLRVKLRHLKATKENPKASLAHKAKKVPSKGNLASAFHT